MDIKDRVALQRWLNAGCSLNDVQRAESTGLVENTRFSHAAVRAFTLLWEWSAFRYSSKAQERAYKKCGPIFVQRRIDRARKMIDTIKNS